MIILREREYEVVEWTGSSERGPLVSIWKAVIKLGFDKSR
jgi:hypothetical protein